MAKKFINVSTTFVPGGSGSGTVDVAGIPGFDKKYLIAIINQTQGVVIYATGQASTRYTSVTGTVVTLFYDTSAMSNTDILQVIYEMQPRGNSPGSTTVSTVATITAPQYATGFILQNQSSSGAAIRFRLSGTATTTSGLQLQPGQDSGYIPCGTDISIVAESGTQNYDIQWTLG